MKRGEKGSRGQSLGDRLEKLAARQVQAELELEGIRKKLEQAVGVKASGAYVVGKDKKVKEKELQEYISVLTLSEAELSGELTEIRGLLRSLPARQMRPAIKASRLRELLKSPNLRAEAIKDRIALKDDLRAGCITSCETCVTSCNSECTTGCTDCVTSCATDCLSGCTTDCVTHCTSECMNSCTTCVASKVMLCAIGDISGYNFDTKTLTPRPDVSQPPGLDLTEQGVPRHIEFEIDWDA
ncbi:MAG: hypothetical protein KKE83_04000 [Proteobacteria bacterium]|nr:hypothetical protein [Pseudomonadota bacterium]MBU1546448.1 hypothetical protein [Pseudomonadota bacterium]MBU2618826.1 hypothetical protein [Pseudomonadota bacterium]